MSDVDEQAGRRRVSRLLASSSEQLGLNRRLLIASRQQIDQSHQQAQDTRLTALQTLAILAEQLAMRSSSEAEDLLCRAGNTFESLLQAQPQHLGTTSIRDVQLRLARAAWLVKRRRPSPESDRLLFKIAHSGRTWNTHVQAPPSGSAADRGLWDGNARVISGPGDRTLLVEFQDVPVALIFVDVTAGALNRSLLESWPAHIHPEDRSKLLAAVAAARSGASVSVELRLAADAARILRMMSITDRREGAMWDANLSSHEQGSEQLQVLMAEMQHRSRNLLTVIHGLTERTLSHSHSIEEFRARFASRLAALGRAQERLAAAHSPHVLNVPELVRDELVAHGVAETLDGRVVLRGPSTLTVDARAGQSIALVLHELATNALKYGALSQKGGRLAVEWRAVANERGAAVELQWHESHISTKKTDFSFGYGRELIEHALPYQFNAETSYAINDDSVRCMLRIPSQSTV